MTRGRKSTNGTPAILMERGASINLSLCEKWKGKSNTFSRRPSLGLMVKKKQQTSREVKKTYRWL